MCVLVCLFVCLFVYVVCSGGILMAGSGVKIGQNVLVLYNDPTPHNIVSLAYSSKQNQASEWIIPGYYYPRRRFHLSLQNCYILHYVKFIYSSPRSDMSDKLWL